MNGMKKCERATERRGGEQLTYAQSSGKILERMLQVFWKHN